MKKRVSRRVGIGLLSAVLAAGLTGVSTYAMAAESAPAAGGESVRLVVGVKPGADVAAPLRRLSGASGVRAMAADGMCQETLASVGARTLEVPAESRDAVIKELRRDPDVEYVEIDRMAKAFDVAPNDPLFVAGEQNDLARLKVPTAWLDTTGSAAVTVAVVDTGVSQTDDLSGAVLPGCDYINGDTDPTDDSADPKYLQKYGHGTLVASLIAARGNDGVERAGVCWQCNILPVKVLDKDGFGPFSTVATGVIYAADQGADIINLSLGDPYNAPVLRDAVAYANSKGALVVAAAGNSGTSTKSYPAAYAGVLAVGGAGNGDTRDPYSNYGASWVDVAAPFRVSTVGTGDFIIDEYGTSFSSPLVAGVAALAKSRKPSLNATALSGLITRTARPLAGQWVQYGMVNAGAATDTAKPTITGATPAQWSRNRGTITVGATGVKDNRGVSRASLYADGVYVGMDTTSPYAVKYNLSKRKGTVKLQWRVYDKAGNSAVFDRSITADNTAPGVKITSAPKDKAKVKGTVKIAVTATDYYGVNRTELLINGKKIQTDKSTPYVFTITASKQPKKMKVQVRAYDNAGNVKYAPTRNWTR